MQRASFPAARSLLGWIFCISHFALASLSASHSFKSRAPSQVAPVVEFSNRLPRFTSPLLPHALLIPHPGAFLSVAQSRKQLLPVLSLRRPTILPLKSSSQSLE
jgi:hypothetical protein